MQVLREGEGWGPIPYQWAVAGFSGAIRTGHTICGALFGGTVFLGYLHGENASQAPDIGDERKAQAIEAVQRLFSGFTERFGDTDCQALTGCDWSKEEDRKRYFEEQVYKHARFKYLEYVLAQCLEQTTSAAGPDAQPPSMGV